MRRNKAYDLVDGSVDHLAAKAARTDAAIGILAQFETCNTTPECTCCKFDATLIRQALKALGVKL